METCSNCRQFIEPFTRHTVAALRDGFAGCYIETICRCCGRGVWTGDREPIHTACIGKHWRNHKYGISASRCHEFSKKASVK